MFQRVLKTVQDGFRKLPSNISKGIKFFNDTQTKVKKVIPQLESGISKSKQIYDELVKPNINEKNQKRVEKVFDFSNDTVNKIKKADSAVDRARNIIAS